LGKEIFNDEEFEEKLNKNTDILCFKNCTLELEIGEKRDSRPEDYSTQRMGIKLQESNPEKRRRLLEILTSIIPNEEVFHYIMKHLASCLSGKIREHRLHIWTGDGSNGKSTIIGNLLEPIFGNYVTTLQPEVLVKNDFNTANAATTSLNSIENKRLCTIQELNGNSKLNEGFIKSFSSGDSMVLRQMYKEERVIKPQHKAIVSLNKLPEIIGTDHGIWRRIVIVKFEKKFIDEKEYNKLSPEEQNHHGILDLELENELKTLQEEFGLLLTEYYTIYRKEGLEMPKKIKDDSKQYQMDSDIIGCFISENYDIEVSNKNMKTFSADLYDTFVGWKIENEISTNISKKELNIYIDRITNYKRDWKIKNGDKKERGWQGISLKIDE
jgi:putative DNA primase/helicase